MEITKKAVQDRLSALKAKREELASNVNAYNGAIQDCEFWLAELERQEVKKDGVSGHAGGKMELVKES